ncbi:MAG: PAS domain S-box protein, partial [Planctomycetes bacterium]|nr:PAS domain S-box protein [Planctomycetota bacterium]
EIDPDFPLEDWPAHWQKVKKPGRLTFEGHHRTKDGHVFPIEITTNYLKKGPDEFVWAYVHDITERKRAEEALRMSETRLDAFFNCAPVGMVILDDQLRYLKINETLAEINGIPVEEHVGKTVQEVVPEIAPMIVPMFRRILETGEPVLNVDVTGEVPSQPGVVRHWIISQFRIPREDSKWGIGVIVVEFTDRKRAEVELRESEERIRALLEGAFEGIVIYEKGKILEANQAFADMYGYALEEVIGLSPVEMTTPGSARKIARHIARGEEKPYEIVGLRKDGTTFEVEALGKNCMYRGRVARITAMRDISDRKQAQKEVQQLQDKLAHVSRLSTMGEMATGLAHELNQPLTAISTYCYVGKQSLAQASKVDTEQLRELFEKLSAQAMRAGEIIRRLRGLVGKRTAVRSQVDVIEPIQEVLHLLESDLRQSEVRVELQADHANGVVTIDEIQIQQVLVNLIRNAVDAMSETQRERRSLTITTSRTADELIDVAVCDTGEGIPVESSEQVFDAFFSSKSEGMGMGLAISRTIIESHGGRLWWTPNPNRGVTFHFTLPMAKEGSNDDGE